MIAAILYIKTHDYRDAVKKYNRRGEKARKWHIIICR